MDALLSFLVSAFALTGSPGPNTLSLAAVGASFGRARGMAFMAGLNLGVVLVIALVGSGLSGLALALPGVRPVVAWAELLVAAIGVVNLTWLTIGAALTRVLRAPRAARAVNIAFAFLLLVSVALSVM